MRFLFLALIKLYQWTLAYFIGGQCRFHPSCSNYGLGCFQRFPPLKAMWYTMKRILRCHPWSEGGSDPVPQD